ncbi:MAG TPA: hypothetical protein PLN52_01110, partial [Opitutaceae bacterium]|nr:hypothetical protein [Opitutaceae bacterium]
YTDNSPTSTVTTYHYSDYNYYSPTFRDSTRFSGFSSTNSFTIERQRVFFPGSEPALAQPVTKKPQAVRGYNVPAKLETYVSEIFFAPLSAHLYDESLSKKRQQRIDTYRSERGVELTELRATLERIRTADTTARVAALRDLSSRQDSRLRELEQRAEEIRDDLTRGTFLHSGVYWNSYRSWRLGDDTRYESAVDEFKVMRGAAFFQNGMSLGQRRLLREITIELRESSFAGSDPTADIALDAPGPYFFFSPATSRIRLPSRLPTELTTRLEDYRSKKETLKTELRETIYKNDRAWLNSTRTNALLQLAEKQAPAIEELERLAEELRYELVKYPYPDQPAHSILSNDLVKRISSYLKRKEDLQRVLLARLQEIRTTLPTDRVEFERKEGALLLMVVPNRSASSAIKRKREEIIKGLPAFNEQQAATYRELNRERTALREEVSRLTTTTAKRTSQSIDELLAEFSRSFEKQENWNLYRDYYTAVLEPGLSPEQRRLLYDAAIEELMAYTPLSRL